MAASWSSVGPTTLAPAYLGEAYAAALPLVGVAPSSSVALALAAGDTGLPAGLVIETTDYGSITGTPTGAASVGSSAPYNQSGPGVYTATITNGTSTQKFTIVLSAAPNDPLDTEELSTANQAAVRDATDQ